MHFRNLTDLADIVRANIHKLKDDFDLVVGIPRSGMVPAGMIALLTDRHLLDLESFLSGQTPTRGTTRAIPELPAPADQRRVLIVEDSISSGRSIEAVRKRVADTYPQITPTYIAVIAAPHSRHLVDLYFDTCPHPRAFEWNLLNSWVCEEGAFDLDGVFCVDPKETENDDGPNYLKFLNEAQLYRRPGKRLHRIVTSRLEKYRPETEAWLSHHGVQFDHLDMMQGVSAAERREKRLHAPFKAKLYAADPKLKIFVESDPAQSKEIARLSGKPVLDFTNMTIASPETTSLPYAARQSEALVRNLKGKLRRKFWRVFNPDQ